MPRITNVEVTKKNLPLRITLLVLALIIAAVAFGHGISSCLSKEPGWTTIEVSTGGLSCSEDFAFYYNLGAGQMSATAEHKELKTLYAEATTTAYQLFHNDYASDELNNIRYVNQHINQEITVEPALYNALNEIAASSNRSIYLASVYAQYQQLFVCENDIEAAQYDPVRQPETVDYITKAAAFANDPQMINIEILDDQKVAVRVSQAYLSFAEEMGIEYFLDFSWMTNAFVADYIADVLIENGFTNGYLASYDGFTRNLCSDDQNFGLNVFQRSGKDVYLPATLNYPGGFSIVSLRDFPVSEDDRWHYYAFDDGRIAHLMIDPADGVEKSAVSMMICYSKSASCAQILLNMAPVYVTDALDAAQVNALKDMGIFAVYPDGNTVCTNDADLNIQVYEGYSKHIIE